MSLFDSIAIARSGQVGVYVDANHTSFVTYVIATDRLSLTKQGA